MRYTFCLVCLLFGIMMSSWGQPADDPKSQILQNSDYYLEAEVTNLTPYVGEQMLYILRHYYVLESYEPGQFFRRLPEFSGFWVGDINGDDSQEPRVDTIAGRQFSVREITVEITPLQAGILTIEPSQLSISPSIFRPGKELLSNPVIVNVQPLPDPKPEDFNGAVGQYDIEQQINQTQISLGESIALEWIIEGLGNFDVLSPPNLPESPNWRIYPEPSNYQDSDVSGTLQFGQKTFRWNLVPTQTGTQSFPSIRFSFFDPKLEEYRMISSDPISIEVFPGASGEQFLLDFDESVFDQALILPLKSVEKPLNSNFKPSIFFWFIWAIPPLMFSGILLRRFEREIVNRRKMVYRRHNALKIAIKKLNRHTKYEKTLYEYVANKSGTGSVLRSLSKADDVLLQHFIAEEARLKFKESFRQAEGFRYAPGQTREVQNKLKETIIDTMRIIDKQWQETDE